MIKARQSTQSLCVSDLSKLLGPRLASAAAAGSGVGRWVRSPPSIFRTGENLGGAKPSNFNELHVF